MVNNKTEIIFPTNKTVRIRVYNGLDEPVPLRDMVPGVTYFAELLDYRSVKRPIEVDEEDSNVYAAGWEKWVGAFDNPIRASATAD